MTTLIEFLRARLGEDEAIARTAGVEHRWVAHTVDGWDGSDVIDDRGDGIFTASDGGVADDSAAAHAARWDPVRVLAEVAAKRALVRALESTNEGDGRTEHALRLIAQPYADHPEFDRAWLMPAPIGPYLAGSAG